MSDVSESETESAGAPRAPSEKRTRPLVLVVEDHDDLRELYCVLLRQFGLAAIPIADGEDALRIARSKVPDAILLDLSLPRLAGLEIVKLLRADPATAGIRILVMTGDAHHDTHVQAMAVGCDGVLLKPLAHEKVLAELAHLLRRKLR